METVALDTQYAALSMITSCLSQYVQKLHVPTQVLFSLSLNWASQTIFKEILDFILIYQR